MIVERLTRFDNIYDGYNCNVNGYDCCSEEECINCKHFHDVLEKLGEYEDSGLDPKTVQKVAEFMKLFPQLSEKYLKGE